MRYETPEMKATYLDQEDVVTASLGTDTTITDTDMPAVDGSNIFD